MSRRRDLAFAGLLAGIAGLTLLAGCGQTGPLYLPDDESATVITRPAPASTPAPSPASSSTTAPAPAPAPPSPSEAPVKPRDPASPKR
jgi:predicted small lipoprotein YifL